MKLSIKIILLAIGLILSAGSASAWQQGWEGSSSDAPISSFTLYSSTLMGYEHGSAVQGYSSGSSVTISEPFNGYFAFSVYGASLTPKMTVHGFSSSTTMFSMSSVSSSSPNAWHRYEIIENSAQSGVSYYVDGVYAGAQTYSQQSPTIDSLTVAFSTTGDAGYIYLDDLSTSTASIFSDDEVSMSLGDGQYYRVGCELGSTSGNSQFYARINSPSGASMQQTITDLSEKLIPMSFMDDSGTYSIKLYQSSASGNYYPVATKTFIYDFANSSQIAIDKTNYEPGETIIIDTFAINYEGYYVNVPYYDSTGTLKIYSYDLTSSDQIYNFVIPETSRGGSFVIYLKDADGATKDAVQYNCLASGGLTSLTLDKGLYAPLDMVKIKYAYMPENTVISLKLQQGNTQINTQTWSGISGSGVVTYQLPAGQADNFIINAVSGLTVLGQTTGTIKAGIYFLSGHIIDPSTGSLIPGASITIGTSSTVSDTNGAYNFSVPAGWQSLTISKSGYQSNINKVNIVYPVATQDFYLVSNYSGDGHSLYGIVTDYYTGATVSSAYITIKQGAVSHTLFSYANSGYYMFDSSDITGTWTISVTKAGYYTYTQSVTLSGDTYHQIIMTPTSYSSTGSSGSTDGSGGTNGADGSNGADGTNGINGADGSNGASGTDAATIDSTGVSADRPGRDGAKSGMETLEATIPGLISLVVFRVMIELIG